MTAPLNLCHWINGKRVEADRPSVRTNPSDTNEIVAHLPQAGPAEVEAAVSAAREALDGWSGASPEVRADILDRAAALLLERRETLGRLLSREEGKTLAEGLSLIHISEPTRPY